MIRLCKNIFYKPKYGSDADSMMLKRLFSTVTTVLVCLAAISFSAYAFFSYSVTSGANTLESSTFSASVTIEKDNSSITEGKIQSYQFGAPGKYTVTVTADDSVTGTGYCIVSINGVKYYTQQLGKDLNAPGGERKAVSFVLDVTVNTTVTFDIRWGTNSNYNTSGTENKFYIRNSEPLQVIVADGTQNIADNTEETESKETEPKETEPEESTSEETTATTAPAETVHTVQSGESLALIADKYGTTYSILAEHNSIEDPRLIQPGQEIRIPTEQTE